QCRSRRPPGRRFPRPTPAPLTRAAARADPRRMAPAPRARALSAAGRPPRAAVVGAAASAPPWAPVAAGPARARALPPPARGRARAPALSPPAKLEQVDGQPDRELDESSEH